MNVVRPGDNVCLVELPTELIDSDEKPVIDACAPESPDGIHSVILDFSGVRTMNGLGASLLAKLGILARRRGQRLLTFGVNSHYSNVLTLTGLDKLFSIYSNRGAAFAAAGASFEDYPVREAPSGAVRDTSYWAKPVSRLDVGPLPSEAINKNMIGRGVVGPVDGFGQLWQKTYRLKADRPRLAPEDFIKALKQNFPSFQPSYNRFYPSAAGIQPGEVVAIDSSTPGGPVSTGVMVLYADERSFTFITPQGHPESGWVTFSASESNGGVITQILGLARANDPVYEAAFRAVGSSLQVRIWTHVLTSLAAYMGVPADVTVETVRLDRRVQWSQAVNVWHNAQIRTIFYMPLRLLGKPLRDRGRGK